DLSDRGESAELLAPSAADGEVAAVLWVDGLRYLVMEVRTAPDTWERLGVRLLNIGAGISGSTAIGDDGDTYVTASYGGGADVLRGRQWENPHWIGTLARPVEWDRVV